MMVDAATLPTPIKLSAGKKRHRAGTKTGLSCEVCEGAGGRAAPPLSFRAISLQHKPLGPLHACSFSSARPTASVRFWNSPVLGIQRRGRSSNSSSFAISASTFHLRRHASSRCFFCKFSPDCAAPCASRLLAGWVLIWLQRAFGQSHLAGVCQIICPARPGIYTVALPSPSIAMWSRQRGPETSRSWLTSSTGARH